MMRMQCTQKNQMQKKIHNVHMMANHVQKGRLYSGISLKKGHTMSASMAAFWVSNISWIFCFFNFWSSLSLARSRFPTTALSAGSSVCNENQLGVQWKSVRCNTMQKNFNPLIWYNSNIRTITYLLFLFCQTIHRMKVPRQPLHCKAWRQQQYPPNSSFFPVQS